MKVRQRIRDMGEKLVEKLEGWVQNGERKALRYPKLQGFYAEAREAEYDPETFTDLYELLDDTRERISSVNVKRHDLIESRKSLKLRGHVYSGELQWNNITWREEREYDRLEDALYAEARRAVDEYIGKAEPGET